MLHRASNCCWLASLLLAATLLGAQSQPQPQTQSKAESKSGQQPQPQAQPLSPQQQALQAFADKLIAAPNDEARNALLAANSELVTTDLVYVIGRERAGYVYRTQKDMPKARAIYEIALALAQRMNDKVLVANCLSNIGLVLTDQGDYEASLEYFRKAIAVSEAAGGEGGDAQRAASYNNMGITLNKQGNFREAADYHTRALKLREASGNKAGIAITSFNLGNVYLELGNERLALEQYKRSLELSRELGNQLGIGYNTDAFGRVYQIQGDYDLALSYFEQSLKVKEKAANEREVGNTLINIALVYEEIGKAALAREYLEKALKLKETSGDKEGVALALLRYGSMLRELGDYPAALDRCRASVALGESLGLRSLLPEVLTEMAKTYYAQRDYAQTLQAGQRASGLARQIGATGELSQALDITAQALIGLDKSEEARSTLAEAIAAVEELRGQVVGSEEERVGFFAQRTAPYQHMVQLLVSQNKADEALAVAEQAKARILLDIMRSGRVRIDKAMTAQELDQQHKLVSRLTSLNVQLSVEKSKATEDAARVVQLNAALDQARLEYRSFQNGLYAAHPELQVERGDAKPVSVARVAALLPDTKTALLEFEVTEDKTYLFVLVKSADSSTPRLTTYTLPVAEKDLTLRVDHFREQLATRDAGYGQSALSLYRLLLGPARSVLAGKNRIVIAPDGPLWGLPFQALQPSAGHHLLQDAAVSLAPSLTILLEMARHHEEGSNGDQRLLALGNPAFSKQDAERLTQQASLAPNEHALRDLPVDLPNAAHEVAALSRLYGAANSAIYTGTAASEQTFKVQAEKYDVLHLATHGVFDDRNPMYSHLLLAGPGPAGDDDGLLEAWEVFNMNLKANLVVLSACETARGKSSGGEGLIGMSWAFFVAGTPSLVASQWKVDSASTTDLMLNFHRGLRYHSRTTSSSTSKARALQQAALTVMKNPQYRHPFYWAGFVLIGNGS